MFPWEEQTRSELPGGHGWRPGEVEMLDLTGGMGYPSWNPEIGLLLCLLPSPSPVKLEA